MAHLNESFQSLHVTTVLLEMFTCSNVRMMGLRATQTPLRLAALLPARWGKKKSNNEKQLLLPSFSSVEEVSLGSGESSHAIPSFLRILQVVKAASPPTAPIMRRWRAARQPLCLSSFVSPRPLWYDCFFHFLQNLPLICESAIFDIPYWFQSKHTSGTVMG